MTDEYKDISEQIETLLQESELPENQKYSLLATCLAKVAHQYNASNFALIKTKLAIVCKTMLDAIEKAEGLYDNLKKIQSK